MIEDPVWLRGILDDLKHKARNWPPDEFFDHVEKLVESSRRHIESHEDSEVRQSLLELYQGIIKYAFACQFQALSLKDPGSSITGISAAC